MQIDKINRESVVYLCLFLIIGAIGCFVTQKEVIIEEDISFISLAITVTIFLMIFIGTLISFTTDDLIRTLEESNHSYYPQKKYKAIALVIYIITFFKILIDYKYSEVTSIHLLVFSILYLIVAMIELNDVVSFEKKIKKDNK
ncbi:hypothetical protein N4T42_02175 [Riemerella anatipestifer]|uniref:hypothetical protein n=1 Tax=Riemerella anatipestifer TaxID=34085 RepID=UPI0021D5B36F|nr:hypothetical protein [Riemerella anatipestifer]MCU7559109.1 hypothetical protein [Riemerella anatipestifer]MDY3400681.1 hypothetical protein [Riemerella anatipestifer]